MHYFRKINDFKDVDYDKMGIYENNKWKTPNIIQ